MQVFNLGMWLVFRCQALGNHDFQFLLDEKDNNHIIVGAGIFEKFDYLAMKQHLLAKTTLLNRCRSKLVKKFGLYWFQELSEKDWKEQIPNVLQLRQDITSEKDLLDLVCREQEVYDFHGAP